MRNISTFLLLHILIYFKVVVHVYVALHLETGPFHYDKEVQRFAITGDSWHIGKVEEVNSL